MAEKIDPFELPRDDWYDSDGRIYKDALIENFNAIEEKLLEIANLDAFKTTLVDTSTITYEDVTLNSDEDKIINLRSLLALTGLVGYPIEMVTSGTKITKLCYWKADGVYKALTKIKTGVTEDKPYIYLNYVDDTVTISDSSETPENSCFIGYYVDGIIKHVNGFDYAGINGMYYLANMHIDTLDVNMYNEEHFREHAQNTGHNLNGATIGGTDLDTGSESIGVVRFYRQGRTSA